MKILPRHVVCVLGNWSDFSRIELIVDEFGDGFAFDAEYSQLAPDKRMKEAFKASVDHIKPTIRGDEWRKINSHTAVAYILSPPIKKEEAETVSAKALLLTAELLKQGGVAAKSESAGLAHGRDHWLGLAREYKRARKTEDDHSAAATLYFTWVQRAIHDVDSGVLYSVGMQLLGHRDVEIDDELDVSTAVEWIDLMGLYLVADKPSRKIRDGQGFRLSEDGPRRIIALDECLRYAEDDFFFNPHGYIRLGADDE